MSPVEEDEVEIREVARGATSPASAHDRSEAMGVHAVALGELQDRGELVRQRLDRRVLARLLAEDHERAQPGPGFQGDRARPDRVIEEVARGRANPPGDRAIAVNQGRLLEEIGR